MSPALISLSSLYHRNFGVGTPITLHSRDTMPRCVSSARSCSTKIGFLYAFGTEMTNGYNSLHRTGAVGRRTNSSDDRNIALNLFEAYSNPRKFFKTIILNTNYHAARRKLSQKTKIVSLSVRRDTILKKYYPVLRQNLWWSLYRRRSKKKIVFSIPVNERWAAVDDFPA